MPQIESGKTIEKLYWELVRAMSPAERYRKALRLNANVRAMVEMQIREQQPGISDQSLKFAVARRYYWDEPKVLKMLDEAEKTGKENNNE